MPGTHAEVKRYRSKAAVLKVTKEDIIHSVGYQELHKKLLTGGSISLYYRAE